MPNHTYRRTIPPHPDEETGGRARPHVYRRMLPDEIAALIDEAFDATWDMMEAAGGYGLDSPIGAAIDRTIDAVFALHAIAQDYRPREASPFGVRVREARLARGWRQADLASRAGCDLSHVCRVELGSATPSAAIVARIAAALDIPSD